MFSTGFWTTMFWILLFGFLVFAEFYLRPFSYRTIVQTAVIVFVGSVLFWTSLNPQD